MEWMIEKIKRISSGLAIIFITGVSPVTMDDVTSGLNIGDNTSTDRMFNELLRFTENEVRASLRLTSVSLILVIL